MIISEPVQRQRLNDRRCAFCGAPLVPGPRGGAAQNFYCSNRDDCRSGFNLTFWRDELVFRQDIGDVGDAAFDLWRRTPAQ